MDTAFDWCTVDLGVPRQNYVDSVATRRNALSDRLEECAHRVPGKPWIGRANHDDGMGHDINRTVPRGQCGRERWTLLPSPFESQRGDLF